MELSRDRIVELLRERGDHEDADAAERELPEQVDHEQHKTLLERLGIDPSTVERIGDGLSGLL